MLFKFGVTTNVIIIIVNLALVARWSLMLL